MSSTDQIVMPENENVKDELVDGTTEITEVPETTDTPQSPRSPSPTSVSPRASCASSRRTA
ncbi:hypothetical protein H4K36_18290 [Streptomyces sp. DHE7-1]|nr:hypothetical protein [Streptomyces sp. DHE7-1]